jgi:hypothetical protein
MGLREVLLTPGTAVNRRFSAAMRHDAQHALPNSADALPDARRVASGGYTLGIRHESAHDERRLAFPSSTVFPENRPICEKSLGSGLYLIVTQQTLQRRIG